MNFKVVVAGAGVAGLETIMALRSLAGPGADITLVAPDDEFVYRPLAVAEPFGAGAVHRYALDRIASDLGVTHVRDELSWVAVRGQRAFLAGGGELGYDALALALGARAYPAWPHVTTFHGPRDVELVRSLAVDVAAGDVRSVAFVVPTGTTWSLPAYELALMLALRAQEAGTEAEIDIFTPEKEPLAVFGRDASAEVARLLAEAGVRVARGAKVEVSTHNDLILPFEETPTRYERVIAIPRLEGPAPRGIPCDDDGFIPIDSHGLVRHVDHVYAAGDGTDFPVKQGGIATQQADAVAEVIAKRAGARVDPRPFRPVLRTQLMANGSSRYLRGELHPRDAQLSHASEAPMWWPPGKIVSAHLSPYLAALDAEAAAA